MLLIVLAPSVANQEFQVFWDINKNLFYAFEILKVKEISSDDSREEENAMRRSSKWNNTCVTTVLCNMSA